MLPTYFKMFVWGLIIPSFFFLISYYLCECVIYLLKNNCVCVCYVAVGACGFTNLLFLMLKSLLGDKQTDQNYGR